MNTMELSGQKEKLFERYSRGELSFDQLAQQVSLLITPLRTGRAH